MGCRLRFVRKHGFIWKWFCQQITANIICGDFLDLELARGCCVEFLEPKERSMADDGYKNSKYFLLHTDKNSSGHKYIMRRHETVNKRIKQFNVLSHTFRHELSLHKICFHAVVNFNTACNKIRGRVAYFLNYRKISFSRSFQLTLLWYANQYHDNRVYYFLHNGRRAC